MFLLDVLDGAVHVFICWHVVVVVAAAVAAAAAAASVPSDSSAVEDDALDSCRAG